jgi:hypothetical protein
LTIVKITKLHSFDPRAHHSEDAAKRSNPRAECASLLLPSFVPSSVYTLSVCSPPHRLHTPCIRLPGHLQTLPIPLQCWTKPRIKQSHLNLVTSILLQIMPNHVRKTDPSASIYPTQVHRAYESYILRSFYLPFSRFPSLCAYAAPAGFLFTSLIGDIWSIPTNAKMLSFGGWNRGCMMMRSCCFRRSVSV